MLSNIKYITYLIVALALLGALWFFYSQYSAITLDEREGDTQQSVSGGIQTIKDTFFDEDDDLNATEKTSEDEEFDTVLVESELLQLTNFAVISPSLNEAEDRVIFYEKNGGDLLSYDFVGSQPQKISNLTIIGLFEALRSPERDRSVARYIDGEIIKSFLHIGTSSVATLPQNIRSISWSPDGASLAYLVPNGTALDLIIGNDSGNARKNIFSTSILDAQIHWASKNIIAFETAPSGFAEGFIFSYSRSSGVFRKIVGPSFGLMSLWSPDGSRILTTSTDRGGKNGETTIRDSLGAPELVVRDFTTLAKKCVWVDNDTLYCAVPSFIPLSSILPDDYLRGELNTSDKILKLDLKTEKTQEIFNEGKFDMSNLIITQDQSHLFFVDRNDGTLWRIKIK